MLKSSIFTILFGAVMVFAQQKPDDDALMRAIQTLRGAEDDTGIVFPTDAAPEPTKRIKPEYTDRAKAADVEGVVTLDCVIRKDGTLSVLRVVKGLGYGLDESARTALEQWRFRPAMVNGMPAEVRLTVGVSFKLP